MNTLPNSSSSSSHFDGDGPPTLEEMEPKTVGLSWEPTPQLTPQLNPHMTRGAPHLHFGFALSSEEFFAYARARGLVNPQEPGAPLSIETCSIPVVKHLRAVADANRLYLTIPSLPTPGHVVVALYSNYTMMGVRYQDEDEHDVVRIIKKEFQLDRPPMWYWSAEY
ncbi:hypothetical protein BV25DRAFT_1919248 [Artomyces pyxidatus]|uniref:Uncharacterized protein n=1 Tax=Artomyces pyxidatus TaxID=48021 RepID=A0ACB8SQQ2_9AGAM|nr:hypothetical protein BV25DRAFT_1919248 [Artomyces pyxidatus]